ncbi:1-acyl-sn-glycerol-3-phosphate acyltransferase [Cryomorphaceae bacterium 1068]|nr:1-acyl-sn-glycerol-3-phosphate acyltransferase [Cryomorphaceae bacterium 1068]
MISALFTQLCVWWFKLSGWGFKGTIPADKKQYVLVVAPHTSNIDFFVGVAARKLLKINVKYLAKKELFKFPFRGLFLGLGGYPVDRSKNNSLVDQVVGFFNGSDDFALCVTPEGTRQKTDTLKTGFYVMAQKAKVPIVLVGFDFALKKVVISEFFEPAGNMEEDLNHMREFFEKITPKHPELTMYQQS